MSPKSSENQKKKERSLPQFRAKFRRNSWDLCVLTGPFSSDQPALKSQWGEAKSRWGTLTLDGGTRPPYNLGTGTFHTVCSGGSRKFWWGGF